MLSSIEWCLRQYVFLMAKPLFFSGFFLLRFSSLRL